MLVRVVYFETQHYNLYLLQFNTIKNIFYTKLSILLKDVKKNCF